MDLLNCRSDPRRDAVRRAADRNGLDYIEVVDGPPPRLHVYFLGRLPREFAGNRRELAQYLELSGGERITGLKIVDVIPQRASDDEHDDSLIVTLDRIGDFSAYALRLTGVTGIDRLYATARFTFRIDCAADADCRPADECAPQPLDEPRLDYLAKDYASFRRLIFDRLALLVPGWTERHVPDLGVTLVELLAYAGDYLSYFQDAVATEAYLGTARRRISVRRHARLVDYRLHEGCNARTWVHLKVSADVALPADAVGFITGANDALGTLPAVLDESSLQSIPTAAYEYFEPVVADRGAPIALRAAHHEIQFHTWGRRECCLPAGSTHATLLDRWVPAGDRSTSARALDIRKGDVLIFEEVLGPRTLSEADADPRHRWAVRVTGAQATEDPLCPIAVGDGEATRTMPAPLVEISWARADALPFALCISAVGAPPECKYRTGISVARGNIVLVDHGRTTGPEELDPLPGTTSAACCECEGHASDVSERLGRFDLALRKTPITFSDRPPTLSLAAVRSLAQDPRSATPAIRLAADGTEWRIRQDLLDSGPDDRDVVVEIDDDAVARLRFGNGGQGRLPRVGSAFTARYRIGCGTAGNVGAETISRLVLKNLQLDGVTIAVRNPLPAVGGVDPEPIADAKLFAPRAFRDPMQVQRAITGDDYAVLAARNRALQGASARLVWTGSWYEADVAVDPLQRENADRRLLEAVEYSLYRYRRMGHDLHVKAAVYVPITLALSACALPGYERGQVKAALLAAFGSRFAADGKPGYFHPDRLRLGQDLYLSPILAAAQAVPGVECVTVERFHRQFEPPRNEIADGVLPLASNEIAQLDNDPDLPERGQLAIVVRGGY